MLNEIHNSGLENNQYIDFIFLKFSDYNPNKIEIVGASTSSISDNATSYEYIDFFTEMGEKATKCFLDNKSTEQFVSSLSISFKVRILLKKGLNIFTYIKNLSDILKP